jgi:hypothetical protein
MTAVSGGDGALGRPASEQADKSARIDRERGSAESSRYLRAMARVSILGTFGDVLALKLQVL